MDVRGGALNVSDFVVTDETVAYGKDVVAALGMKVGVVVDTSRNGQGEAPDTVWCNPPGRGLGQAPTTDTSDPLVHAFLGVCTADDTFALFESRCTQPRGRVSALAGTGLLGTGGSGLCGLFPRALGDGRGSKQLLSAIPVFVGRPIRASTLDPEFVGFLPNLAFFDGGLLLWHGWLPSRSPKAFSYCGLPARSKKDRWRDLQRFD